MLHVQVVLFDGFDLLDAVAPYEVFGAAGAVAGAELSVEFVTAEGPRLVTSGVNGVQIEAAGMLNPGRTGIILVPGASGELEGDGPDTVPALLARAMNTELTGMVKQALDNPDVVVATVCGGSMLLAMGGLLEGRSAVTHHLGMDALGAMGVKPVKARVVDDGNLVTGGGVTSGLDVALYVLERELGPQVSLAVEDLFEFERRGTVWRNTGITPEATVSDSNETIEPESIQHQADSGQSGSSAFIGEWDTTIATPIGKMEVKLHIREANGMLQGTALMGDEAIPFIDPELKGGTLSWSQSITKPMRLNLKFEVHADGNAMSGTAKAGLLPASKITGKRVGEGTA